MARSPLPKSLPPVAVLKGDSLRVVLTVYIYQILTYNARYTLAYHLRYLACVSRKTRANCQE
jgi:hypothetical protein